MTTTLQVSLYKSPATNGSKAAQRCAAARKKATVSTQLLHRVHMLHQVTTENVCCTLSSYADRKKHMDKPVLSLLVCFTIKPANIIICAK